MATVGFTSSNWTWTGTPTRTHPLGNRRAMGASLYYRGGMAAAHFAARGMGGWVAERCRTNRDGAMELLAMDGSGWHAPDVVWTEFIGCTPEDLEATRRGRAAGQVVVGDLDDDVWQVPKTNDAHAIWDNPYDRPLYWDQLAECDAVITSTIDLAHKARARLKRPVYLIRNAVDTTWLTPHDPCGLPIAWIGSTPWRANDLALLRAAGLSRWLADRDQVIYHGGHMQPPAVPEYARAIGARHAHYGSYPTLAAQAGLDPDQVVTAPNVPLIEYPGLWHRVGVSLIPLEDCAFNRAKSWLKGLESCAAGVPIIVSAGFSEYEALRDEEGAAILVARSDKPRQWLECLEMCESDEARRTASRINLAVARRNDISRRWAEWLAVLNDVAGGILHPVVDRVASASG